MTSNFAIEKSNANIIVSVLDTEETFLYVDTLWYSPAKEEPYIKQTNVHTENSTVFTLTSDGLYKIHHIVIPLLSTFTSDVQIFFTLNAESGEITIYRTLNGTTEEILVDDLLTLDLSDTNLVESSSFIFSILNLQRCYIMLAEQTLKYCFSECGPHNRNLNTLEGKRDFIWAAINVLKYYISFGLFEKAQLLLERISGCRGICDILLKNPKAHGTGCGCSLHTQGPSNFRI